MKLHGIIPAMVTPATADGLDVDLHAARLLARRLIDCGVHGLFAASSTGEAPLLTRGQRLGLVEAVVEAAQARVPIIAGVGSPSTAQSIDLARDAVSAGANAIAILPMHFIPLPADELYGYFAAVADSVEVPTLLYNYPKRTGGQNIPVDVAYRLKTDHNVVGIKDSSAVLSNALGYQQLCGHNFAVFTGQEAQLLALLLTGGHGAICGAANVYPELLVALYNAAHAHDLVEGRRLHDIVVKLAPLFEYGTFPASYKCAVTARLAPVGPPFKPVNAISDEQKAAQEVAMEHFEAQLLGD